MLMQSISDCSSERRSHANMDRFRNWSTLEFALLAVVILLICAIGAAVVLLAGGFLVEREIAQPPGASSPDVAGALTPIVAPGEEGVGAEDTRSITPRPGPASRAASLPCRAKGGRLADG